MSREWKPGDVALVQNEYGVWNTAILQVRPGGVRWTYGVAFADAPPTWPARPLVVIDPEDREDVERLRDLWDAAHKEQQGFAPSPAHKAARANGLQAALREFANPPSPKPEEPGGWLAVIEDDAGVEWYRWSVRPSDRHRAWISVMDEGRCYPTAYSDIAAVKVLNEGVQP